MKVSKILSMFAASAVLACGLLTVNSLPASASGLPPHIVETDKLTNKQTTTKLVFPDASWQASSHGKLTITLANAKSETVKNSFSATISLFKDVLSATLGYDVTKSYKNVTASATKPVSNTGYWKITAYEKYSVTKFSVTRTDRTYSGYLLISTKVAKGTGTSTKYEGVFYVLTQQYKVTFNSNGGTSVGFRILDKGAVLNNQPQPTLKGHTFAGWYTAKSGGTKVTTSTKITSSRTVYAHWTTNKYTVTFNSEGGSKVAPKTVSYGSTVGTLKTPTYKCHTFLGWFTAKTGGNKISSTTVINNSVTYYAHWK